MVSTIRIRGPPRMAAYQGHQKQPPGTDFELYRPNHGPPGHVWNCQAGIARKREAPGQKTEEGKSEAPGQKIRQEKRSARENSNRGNAKEKREHLGLINGASDSVGTRVAMSE